VAGLQLARNLLAGGNGEGGGHGDRSGKAEPGDRGALKPPAAKPSSST